MTVCTRWDVINLSLYTCAFKEFMNLITIFCRRKIKMEMNCPYSKERIPTNMGYREQTLLNINIILDLRIVV